MTAQTSRITDLQWRFLQMCLKVHLIIHRNKIQHLLSVTNSVLGHWLPVCMHVPASLFSLSCTSPSPVGVQLFFRCPQGVETIDMDVLGLREAKNPSHSLLLKGLCLGKWDSGYAEDICWAVGMDDNNMIGNLQVGSYIIGIKNSSIT